MDQPHDPNVTSDIASAPADSLRAGDPLHTTDHARGSGSTVDSRPAAPPSADASANDFPTIPGYRVLREIARGGMGCVLAAHDLTLDRDVALKILLPEANADRFVRESKITARLPHPGIPPVHALGTLADGSPFLAMKLIAGQTLADELKTADWATRPRLLQAFTQVCQAVGFAHSRGVIHRDLKPANVMVAAFGEVQVMDWGLAKDLSSREVADESCSPAMPPVSIVSTDANQTTDQRAPGESTDDRTQAGTLLGTPAYMAPEQARGEATDARADVFALGGILCAILTGQPPFGGKSNLEVVRRAGAADLAEAHLRLNGCGADADLVALCRRCLSPNPADRPADGQAVADALTAYLHGVQERLQAAERERAVAVAREAEQRKRRRVQMALAAAVAVILLGGGAFAWYSDRQTTERRAEERHREQQATQGVDAALKLVPDLRKQYKFEAAKKTLDQAAVLAKGGALDRLAGILQARRDLEFVIRLDDIRYRKWIWIAAEGGKGDFNLKIAAPEYRQAFAERDLDMTALDPAEAAKRIAASAVKAELVAAVDDWALYEPEQGVRDRLLDIARRADPGAWTDRLRDPAVRNDSGPVQKLAADADPTSASAATLSVLAQLMARQGLVPVPLLTAARTASPADFELAFLLGQEHFRFKDGQEIGPYQAARALRPENFAVWHNLGGALAGKGQVDEAIACFKKGIELDPKFAGGHFNLGITLSHYKGQVDEAMACYKKVIALDPKYTEALHNLGAILLEVKRDYDGAITCFRQAIELNPKFAQAHYNLGIALHRKDEVDEAIASYQKAIALDPKYAEAHTNLGSAMQRKGQVDEAITCYRKAIELDPKLAEAHSSLGAILCDVKRDYDGAIVCYRKAIELDPKIAQCHYGLGTALARKGQVDEAIASFQKAIALDPKYAEAHCNLGLALKGKGHVDEAIACYQKAIELDPKNAKSHYGLGIALHGKGQVDEAIASFQKAIELDPKDAIAHGNLGSALNGKGQVDEAIACYRKAIELDPKDAAAHYNLGNSLTAKGQVDKAIASYQKAIALDPKYAEAHCNLGHALASQGRFAESLAALKRGQELGTKQPGWPYPSAEWVRQAEVQAALEAKLPALLKGEFQPSDNQERLVLAGVCQVKKLYHTATGLYAAAFAADPKLADFLPAQHRYNAARSAALAAAGQGEDASKLDDAAIAKLRGQALNWLKADLALCTKLLDSGPAQARPFIVQTLSHWQKDSDLAGLRDAAALAKLPAEEQKACAQLWADVAELLKKAEAPAAKEPKQ